MTKWEAQKLMQNKKQQLMYKKEFLDTALLTGGVEDVVSSVLVFTVLIIEPAGV